MNKKQKTYFDIVPTVLSAVVLVRFASRKDAKEYINKHNLVDKWIIVPTTIEL